MRHGIAEDISFEQFDDFGRKLTLKGRKRTRAAALGLRELAPKIDFLAASPKIRARETAEIVREVYGETASLLALWDELMDEDFSDWRRKLRSVTAETALLCGHEPILGRMVAEFLTGSAGSLVLDFKKAGVCALEVELEPFEAVLKWHLTPHQLRKIGESSP